MCELDDLSAGVFARRVGVVIIVAWLIYIQFYALQTAERLYLVNASTYPTWRCTQS